VRTAHPRRRQRRRPARHPARDLVSGARVSPARQQRQEDPFPVPGQGRARARQRDGAPGARGSTGRCAGFRLRDQSSLREPGRDGPGERPPARARRLPARDEGQPRRGGSRRGHNALYCCFPDAAAGSRYMLGTAAGEDHPARHNGSVTTIAITNQKGGVGKTTTTVNLAASLAANGQRVLLIDLDPQGNATMGCGVDKHGLELSVYDVLMHGAHVEAVTQRAQDAGFDVIPANADLTAAEVELVTASVREHRLRDALARVKHDYDYVLIDCPPSLNMLTVNALVAADSVLIPVP
jgi:Mrp family chromosome partitioning ATPase